MIYNDSVKNIITSQKVNAEYAVGVTGDNFSEMFANMEDDYFKARSADVKDISERVISILCGKTSDSDIGDEPVIVVADDLAPSETVQMDKTKLLAFVTKFGSSNSHTAILARTMGIPALIGVDIDEEWNGKTGIIDGFEGKLIVEPDEAAMNDYVKKQEAAKEQKKLLQSLKGKDTVTKSGKQIKLYANIGKPVRSSQQSFRMMRQESDFSEVSSFILKQVIIRRRMSSLRLTNRWQRQWQERKL